MSLLTFPIIVRAVADLMSRHFMADFEATAPPLGSRIATVDMPFQIADRKQTIDDYLESNASTIAALSAQLIHAGKVYQIPLDHVPDNWCRHWIGGLSIFGSVAGGSIKLEVAYQ